MSNYTLNVSLDFSAAHSLRGYVGKCARVHGHNYRVQAEITTQTLNDIGIAVDYFDLKQAMKQLVDQLDHYTINDIPPFDTINPTAENIAKWFYHRLKQALVSNPKTSAGTLTAVTLWENQDFSVRYSE